MPNSTLKISEMGSASTPLTGQEVLPILQTEAITGDMANKKVSLTTLKQYIGSGTITVDQSYNPLSTNPQSGTATAEGIELHNSGENSHPDLRADITTLASNDEIMSKKIDYISKAIKGQEYDVVRGTTPVYSYTVESGTQKYAEKSKIGGMCQVVNEEIVIGKCDKVVSMSKNLIDMTIFSDRFDLQPDGSYKSNQSITVTPYTVDIPANTVVSYKIKCPVGTNYRLEFEYADGTVESGSTVTSTGDWVSVNNLSLNKRTVKMFFNYTTGSTDVSIKELQIELGSTSTAYVPYNKHEYPIPQEIQSLDGYGWSAGNLSNYVDFVEKKFYKKVGKYKFDRPEYIVNLIIADTNYMCYQITVTDMENSVNNDNLIVCDKLVGYAWTDRSNAWKSANGIVLSARSGSNPNNYVRISLPPAISTVALAKQWLAENQPTVYYEVAEEKITDVSQYLDDDNFIETSSGGTVTFHQQENTEIPIHNEVNYIVKISDAI